MAMEEPLQPICASLQRLQSRTCPWIACEEPHGHISTALYMEKWKRVLDTGMQCCLCKTWPGAIWREGAGTGGGRAEELRSEALAKKEIIKFLQENAAQARFKGTDGAEKAAEKAKPAKAEEAKGKAVKAEEAVEEGPPKYTKSILKKGDKTNFPKKGDTVHCWYTGKLQDGTVFDTNIQSSKVMGTQMCR
ncbi:hypothetical protein EK904_011216 [Melospiza melodia maxima]|nr:hypothetical protein EK904_011216 [Melospiza melodia maxima]